MDELHPTGRPTSFLTVPHGPSGLRELAFFRYQKFKIHRLDWEPSPTRTHSYGIVCHLWSGKRTLWSYSKQSLKHTFTALRLRHWVQKWYRRDAKTAACLFVLLQYTFPLCTFSLLIHNSLCSSVLRWLQLGAWILLMVTRPAPHHQF